MRYQRRRTASRLPVEQERLGFGVGSSDLAGQAGNSVTQVPETLQETLGCGSLRGQAGFLRETDGEETAAEQ